MRVLAVLCALLAGPVFAQSPSEVAQAAAVQLQQARAALEEADTRADRVAALTQTVQAYEAGLAAMRDGLRRSALRQREIETDLNTQSDDVARLLGVLQTIGRTPAPMLMLHPNGPTGTARAGMMLADVTPALQDQVTALRAQLNEAAQIRAFQNDALVILEDGLDGAQSARTQLSAAISERTNLPRRFAEDSVQIAVLLASSQTLEAFAAGLTDAHASEGPDGATVKGAIPLPVEGEVIRPYQTPDAAGVVRPGILIATPPRALVSTPVSATIRYAGPLLEYGTVVILEPAVDVLWIVAGLEQAFGEVGQIVPEGAAIGLMGGNIADAQAILNESAQGSAGQSTQTLYLEVRDRQSAVNPAEWFAVQ